MAAHRRGSRTTAGRGPRHARTLRGADRLVAAAAGRDYAAGSVSRYRRWNEALGVAELEHSPDTDRMRARERGRYNMHFVKNNGGSR
jgi:hypothetical protein